MKREFIGIMGKLGCELETAGDVEIVRAEGQADIYTSPELTKILEALVDRGARRIVLDLEKLTYLDSSALAGLLKILKKLKPLNGSIKLVGLGGKPLEVFELSRFLDLFENFPDRETALRSFSS